MSEFAVCNSEVKTKVIFTQKFFVLRTQNNKNRYKNLQKSGDFYKIVTFINIHKNKEVNDIYSADFIVKFI